MLSVAVLMSRHGEGNRLFEGKVPDFPSHPRIWSFELRFSHEGDDSFCLDDVLEFFKEVMVGVDLMLSQTVLVEVRIDEGPEVLLAQTPQCGFR